MTEVSTTLLSVESKQSGINSKKPGSPFWIFTAANGKELLCFKAPVAAEGMALIGVPSLVDITEKASTKPDYPEPSYFMNSIVPDHSVAAPAGVVAPTGVPLDAPETDPNANGAETKANPLDSFNRAYNPLQDPKQSMIVRQSAFKAACFLLAGVYNGSGDFAEAYNHLRALTDELIRLGLTGQWDLEPQNVPVEAVPWEE